MNTSLPLKFGILKIYAQISQLETSNYIWKLFYKILSYTQIFNLKQWATNILQEYSKISIGYLVGLQKSFRYKSVKIWNSIDTNLKSMSISKFTNNKLYCPSWPTWGMPFTASNLQIGAITATNTTSCKQLKSQSQSQTALFLPLRFHQRRGFI